MISDVEEVETFGDKFSWGKALRLRVLINVHNPLRRCSKLALPNGDNVLVTFKYERLSNLCYVCGCLDHMETNCDVAILMKKLGMIKMEYKT
ncbi:hypothetical protein REPUB_Repub11eG0108100 [Reevesia pubescens]